MFHAMMLAPGGIHRSRPQERPSWKVVSSLPGVSPSKDSCDPTDIIKKSALKRENERMKQLWESVTAMKSDFCDVKIGVRKNIDSDERVWIGANKNRLKEQSAFFQAVWKDPVTGIEDHICEELELDGISEAGMRAIIAISYARYESITINESTLAEYLFAAQKYGVQLLMEWCKGKLEYWADCLSVGKELNQCVETLINLHRLGMTHYVSEIIQRGKIFHSSARIKSVFLSDAALKLPFDLFSEMIQQDSLTVPESKIWKRCIEWACLQCDEEITESEEQLGSSSEDSELKEDESIGDVKSEDEERKDEDSEDGMIECEDEMTSISKELRRLKHFIRFPLMNGEEMADLTQWQTVFSADEISEILYSRFKKSSQYSSEPRRKVVDFIRHMSVDEVLRLRQSDLIDFRDERGCFVPAKIVRKVESKLRILYFEGDNERRVSLDCVREVYRFAVAGSITQQPRSRLFGIREGDKIDIHPSMVSQSWFRGVVEKTDKRSGQVRVSFERSGQKHTYYAHLNDPREVAPYLFHRHPEREARRVPQGMMKRRKGFIRKNPEKPTYPLTFQLLGVDP